ncbi:MAG: ATP-binding cassette domain-containing protein, partial [Mangrovibacterium sp.]
MLKGIDLEIPAGKLYSIVGPSGAGKTTLLQILGTLSYPDSGN